MTPMYPRAANVLGLRSGIPCERSAKPVHGVTGELQTRILRITSCAPASSRMPETGPRSFRPKSLTCNHFASLRNDIAGCCLGEDIHRLNISTDGELRRIRPQLIADDCGQLREPSYFSTATRALRPQPSSAARSVIGQVFLLCGSRKRPNQFGAPGV